MGQEQALVPVQVVQAPVQVEQVQVLEQEELVWGL